LRVISSFQLKIPGLLSIWFDPSSLISLSSLCRKKGNYQELDAV
jgi:hypothetical protein